MVVCGPHWWGAVGMRRPCCLTREQLALSVTLPPKWRATNETTIPRPALDDGIDKFRRNRSNRKAAGMRLVHIWVPDPTTPALAATVQREAEVLRGALEEHEALDFIEAPMRDLDDDR